MSCLLIAIDYDDIYQIQTTVVSFTQKGCTFEIGAFVVRMFIPVN